MCQTLPVRLPSKCLGPVVYDGYGLLPVETADALGHTTTVRYDYRLLQARLVTDPNLNRTAYGLSAVGLLHHLLGKENAGEGDLIAEAVPATARTLRYQPSTWLDYDFFSFTQREQNY